MPAENSRVELVLRVHQLEADTRLQSWTQWRYNSVSCAPLANSTISIERVGFAPEASVCGRRAGSGAEAGMERIAK